MLNTIAILARIRQGNIPATWRIFRSTMPRPTNVIVRFLSHPTVTCLLLMPDGLIEYTEKNGKPAHIIRNISYDHIASITMKMWSPDDTDLNRRTHTNTIQVALDLRYKDGKRELWQLDSSYGSPETIAHSILAVWSASARLQI